MRKSTKIKMELQRDPIKDNDDDYVLKHGRRNHWYFFVTDWKKLFPHIELRGGEKIMVTVDIQPIRKKKKHKRKP